MRTKGIATSRSSHSLRVRMRYRFDNALSRGPGVVIGYLALLALLVVVAAGLISTVLDLSFGKGAGFGESVYQSMTRMLDPGTFSGDSSWGLRALTLLVTLTGVILGGSL